MSGKQGMNKGNMGGQREGSGRLGQSARLKAGDMLSGVWRSGANEEWGIENYEVIEANRKVIRLKQKDGSILSLHR